LGNFPPSFVELLLSRQPTQGLFAWGRSGVGKTHLLSAMVRHIAITTHAECQIRRVTWERLCLKAKSRRGAELKVLKPLFDVDLLALEDLGTGSELGKKESVSSARLLTTLLDASLENEKPLFISSNKSPEQLGFGERIRSRLRTFKTVELVGRDRRIDVQPGHLF